MNRKIYKEESRRFWLNFSVAFAVGCVMVSLYFLTKKSGDLLFAALDFLVAAYWQDRIYKLKKLNNETGQK